MGLGTLTAGLGTLVPGLGVHASTLGVLTAGMQGGGAPAPTYLAQQWITAAFQDQTSPQADVRCFGIVVTNRRSIPMTRLRIWGRNYISSHGLIAGAWRIGGTLNLGAYQGTTHQRITFAGGASTLTPPNGSRSSPRYWESDLITLDEPIPPGGNAVIRVQAVVGSYATSTNFKAGCRPNNNDAPQFARANTAGEFATTPESVLLNPASWNAGINQIICGVTLEADTDTKTRRGAVIGDSVTAGYFGGSAIRDEWTSAANAVLGAGREVVSFGAGGYTVQEYCGNFQQWLTTPHAASFETCVLVPWSWNNRLEGSDSSMRTAVTNAINAGVAAGKRMILWVPVPSCNSTVYPTWTSMLAWAQTLGIPVIQTWQNVADGGVGPALTPALTGDGVHLNAAGQDIQGADIGAQGAVLFP